MRKIRLAVLFIASLVTLGVFTAEIWIYSDLRSNGAIYDFDITGFDPLDPFRGRYLAFRMLPGEIPAEKMDSAAAEKNSGSGYALLQVAPDGRVEVRKFTLQPPPNGNYLACKYRKKYGDKTFLILWPFERYYLNEDIAPEADRLQWNREIKMQARVRVKDGRAVLQAILVDGQPLETYLRMQKR